MGIGDSFDQYNTMTWLHILKSKSWAYDDSVLNENLIAIYFFFEFETY
jgi:hypothetical protein